jgi:catechol 2,3-dioxygenase-like lactoylglutathione lyase family enzyme
MNRALPAALVLSIAAVALHAQAPPSANTPPAATGLVVGSGNFFSPIVANLDRAVAFYRDGLGLQVMGDPTTAENNAPLRNMFGLPDAQLRWNIARPAGMRTGVEIIEISKANGRPLTRTISDPGAFTLVATVTDVDATLARLKTTGATVMTVSGAPLTVPLGSGKARAVVVRDRDNHFVELVQPDKLPESAAAGSGVIDVHVRLTVDSVDSVMKLYRDALGLQQQQPPNAFAKDRTVLDLLGVPKGEYRFAFAQVPGSGLRIAFMEFRGVDKQAVRGNIQDPGSTRLQLQVRDLDAAIKALVDAGGAIVSSGAAPVELPAGRGAAIKAAIVRDPNNLFVVLIQAAQPAQPARP